MSYVGNIGILVFVSKKLSRRWKVTALLAPTLLLATYESSLRGALLDAVPHTGTFKFPQTPLESLPYHTLAMPASVLA